MVLEKVVFPYFSDKYRHIRRDGRNNGQNKRRQGNHLVGGFHPRTCNMNKRIKIISRLYAKTVRPRNNLKGINPTADRKIC